MIDEGEPAPEFALPAVLDGERTEVALADHLEENVVVLAFYPGDFNPACDGETTDLDELDLFTMQKDVVVLGISGDSVYSHRAFADEYDLHIPLLSDVGGEVTRAYGVAADDPGYLARRAVVVVDPDGDVQYAWAADDVEELPDVDEMRGAVEGVGGGATAQARYRVGHAHYVEGRRAFTSAMHGFEDREWMMAQNDFSQAEEEFHEGADQFNTAARFAEDEDHASLYERAERKANVLSRAAEWLAQAASAFASGEGRKGEQLRADAEAPLETAREIHEPVPPDDFPPEEDPAETESRESVVPTEDGEIDVSLDVDIDEELDADGEAEDASVPAAGPDAAETRRLDGVEAESEAAFGTAPEADEGTETESGRADRDAEGDAAADESGDRDDGATADADEGGENEDDAEEIDEAELEEITAELEEQTRRAAASGSGDEEGAPGEEPEETTGADDGSTGGTSPETGEVDGPEPDVEAGEGRDGTAGPTDATAEAGTERDPDDESGDGPDAADVEEVGEDVELDLTDPTEEDDGDGATVGDDGDGEDEDEDGDEDDRDGSGADLGDGDHGVPDSL